MKDNSLCFLSATDLAAMIRRKDVSCEEVMKLHLAQIDRLNSKVNAIVTLLPERAMDGARQADRAIARGEPLGPLHGLPVAHKDLMVTKGIRTTFGSPIYKDFVPEVDGIIVERLRTAGAITIGKTNTPEFGAGSQTFNPVFGATKNPYDINKTCGGSSGGAAVALACGMVPIADGSDLGGSLRNPASFCNIAGFRPSIGRVPTWPALSAWTSMSVLGPMARTVQDVALMLSAIAGPDERAPISIAEPGTSFARPLSRDFKGVKVAWTRNLGSCEVDQGVTRVLEKHRHVLEDIGCMVENAHPDFRDADEVFQTLRAYHFELNYGNLLATQREQMKSTVVWNIEAGAKLTGSEVGRAEVKRTELYHRVRTFMEKYQYLALPVVQVPPFDIDQEYVTEINGQKMQTYIDWMRSCYYISVTGLPAVSVPCGFTDEGLPIGLQLVGRHHQDFSVLQLAYAFQQQVPYWNQRPSIANGPSQ